MIVASERYKSARMCGGARISTARLPGDSYYLASNVPHGVETIEDTMVLDTFSPPRDDYLALDRQAAGS